MATVKQIRSDILELLFKVKNIETLKAMHQELEVIYKHSGNSEVKSDLEPAFFEGIRPVRENVTLEQLMNEQNYSPCSYEEFRETADQIDWGEITLDEMLEGIK